MSKIYEFKFIQKESYKISKYIILSKCNNLCWLNFISENMKSTVEISHKIDRLCQMFDKIKIQEWNMQTFSTSIELFPSFEWKLFIKSNRINVQCKGYNTYPSNWDMFVETLKFIGIQI